MYGMDFGLQGFLYFIMVKGVGGGHVYRGPMAKLFLWTIFTHDFELYPFDREISYDFVQIFVMLVSNPE